MGTTPGVRSEGQEVGGHGQLGSRQEELWVRKEGGGSRAGSDDEGPTGH